ADSSDSYIKVLNDHSPAATVIHSNGGCNSLSIQALEYLPDDYTGHTYEVRFNPIQKSGMDPLYTYDLVDMTLGSTLLSAEPLSTEIDGNLYIDYSPVIDGFALEFNTQINSNSFRYVNFYVITNLSGFDGNLEIDNPQPPFPFRWAFRGSDYELRWIQYPPDTTRVSLEVYDLTNDVFVPFGTGIGDSWCIGVGNDTLNPATDTRIHLCGGYFAFNDDGMMTVPPAPGDIWKITSSGSKVPCDGNVYTFTTPPAGIEGGESPSMCVLYQNTPNPFNSETSISYSVVAKERIQLKIYDIAGRMVRTLVDNIQNPGYYNIHWDGKTNNHKKLASGIYFYRIVIGDFNSSKKMILLR
ncbi:T9SS type A sorting domain-containing protein, partial [candidate division WOR-3 bacterium]|nr:T9SS type A sorting domain-containing protein [candidate division WOR-3 bacterium]